ncbi:hypothetical protein HHL16_19865 [Pseudoflavitalea sp. G-6-1-2]|uniref:hypothetical protein n=1 Tax=Pseudoflavitalea sp. G-6-1-2 TaxID=2728841 RepID=UPI00146F3622|nr:hypothetical protein [Pseudoflavitalea sp. G-6-1-2]NML23144.1 hypothetical protein [Pseudoflavitalea sp. G-6-1-2]
MRKLLHDMELTEQWLSGELSEEARQQFSFRMLTEPAFYEKVTLQQCSYRVIRFMARQKLKAALENMHAQLMQEPAFSKQIQQIFS